MKYIVIALTRGDQFEKEFETKEEALKQAEIDFGRMTEIDKKHTSEFYVLESVNPDEDAMDHFDGDIVRRWI